MILKIEEAWENRELLKQEAYKNAVLEALEFLNKGELRICEPVEGDWKVNEWLKKAVLLYFSIMPMREISLSDEMVFHDKIPLRKDLGKQGVRVVPNALVRYGAYVSPGAILMPSYVNIGAHVGSGSMIDTWATVGSCAQIGSNVHLSGGVGIGGVLEPPQAQPVIIEDGAFIGSRCIIVEGVKVGKEAVIAAGVTLTKTSKVIDVTGTEPKEFAGVIPPRAVVIPGVRTKKFPAGEFQIPCALIIGKRKESTDKKTSLNEVLREHNLSV